VSPRVAVAEDRPTGRLHLGHLVGSLRNRVALQETHRCVFLVADLRALAEPPLDIRGFSREIVLDWLSVGLDPHRSTFALQSLVPEIGQLAALLSSVAPTSLTAAGLLLFRADEVPVGLEEAGEVELARDLARRFNLTYGRVFAEPRAVPGSALAGTIFLSDGPGDVERRLDAMTRDERAGYEEASGRG
jgi:tryptophanyl-tRNA synthetase